MNKLLPVPDKLQYIRKSETEVLLQWQNRQYPQKPTGFLYSLIRFISSLKMNLITNHKRFRLFKSLIHVQKHRKIILRIFDNCER